MHRGVLNIKYPVMTMTTAGFKSKTNQLSHHDYVKYKHAKRVKGNVEYMVPNIGICDIVSKKYAIEVKRFNGWKHGLGQAQAYAIGSAKKPALHLYDTKGKDTDFVKLICARCGVLVTTEEEEEAKWDNE